MQGGHSDVMFIVESGVVTCHMDFLRLHHRMQLPTLSQDVLAVAPVRSLTTYCHTAYTQLSLAFFAYVCIFLVTGAKHGATWLVTSHNALWLYRHTCMPHVESAFAYMCCVLCDTDQRC